MKLYHIFLLINVIFCVTNDPKMVFPNPSKLTTAFSDQEINRPQFHFTPQFGWMNDPNGLWYDNVNELYHLYYQFNPSDTVWALPLYWGHATSKDLIKWEHATNPLPIGPIEVKEDDGSYVSTDSSNENQETIKISTTVDTKSGAYSGSIFFDDENQSGWFSDKTNTNNKNIIAAWTYNYPTYEAQWLSYSLDNGNYFYNPIEEDKPLNPIIDLDKEYEHFRDPQVIKLLTDFVINEEKSIYTYIMTVAKPQEYKIAFYSSTDLKKWEENIDLELEGFLGYQYECPNLVHLYNSDTTGDKFVDSYEQSYWILFISINPGSINGGSSTWYLIGQFAKNEEKQLYQFTPTYHYPAPLDYGKDFYAMQLIYNSGKLKDVNDASLGNEYIYGIAWASNWQYTGVVPTDPWRSSMSLPRKVSLGKFNSSPERNILFLKSEPQEGGHFPNAINCIATETALNASDTKKKCEIADSTGSFKFEMTFIVNTSKFNNTYPGHFNIELMGEDTSEYLLIGYENGATAFYVDRSHSNVEWVHKNPYFSDKISVNLIPSKSEDKINTFDVKGYVDRNIIELFFNEGYQTMTNTFFFSGGNFINTIYLSSDYSEDGFKVSSFKIYKYSETTTTDPAQEEGD